MTIKREKWKKKARSRDCNCIKGSNRDTNFNEVIDELCDKYDSKIMRLKSDLALAKELITRSTISSSDSSNNPINRSF